MADEFNIDGRSLAKSVIAMAGINVNYTSSGEKQVISTMKEVLKLSENLNASKYIGTQEALVKKLATATKKYSEEKTKQNAIDLIGFSNSLKGLVGEDKAYKELTKDIAGLGAQLKSAVSIAKGVSGSLSKSMFSSIYSMGDALGIADVSSLSSFVAEFEKVKVQIERVKAESTELKAKLDEALSTGKAAELEKKLADVTNALERVRSRARDELSSSLRGLGFSDEDISNKFGRYFKEIDTGATTASSAIAAIKRELNLLDDGAKNNVAVDTLNASIEQLRKNLVSAVDSIDKSLVEIGNRINKVYSDLSSGISTAVANTSSASSSNLPKVVKEAADSMKSVNDIDKGKVTAFASAIKALASATNVSIKKDVATKVDALCVSFSKLAGVDVSGISSTLNNVANLSDKKISGTLTKGINSIVDGVNKIDTTKVDSFSKLNFKKISDVKIDKSISYLTDFANSVKTGDISKNVNSIGKIDLSKFKGVKIDSSIANLKELLVFQGKDLSSLLSLNGVSLGWLKDLKIEDQQVVALERVATALERISKNSKISSVIAGAVNAVSGVTGTTTNSTSIANAMVGRNNISFNMGNDVNKVNEFMQSLGASEKSASVISNKIKESGFDIEKVSTSFKEVTENGRVLTQVLLQARNNAGGLLTATLNVDSETGEIASKTWTVTQNLKDQMVSMAEVSAMAKTMSAALSRTGDVSNSAQYQKVAAELAQLKQILASANGDVAALNNSFINSGETGAAAMQRLKLLVDSLLTEYNGFITKTNETQGRLKQLTDLRDRAVSVLGKAGAFTLDDSVNSSWVVLSANVEMLSNAIDKIINGKDIGDALKEAFDVSDSNAPIANIEKDILSLSNRMSMLKDDAIFTEKNLNSLFSKAATALTASGVDKSSNTYKLLANEIKDLNKIYEAAGMSADVMYQNLSGSDGGLERVKASIATIIQLIGRLNTETKMSTLGNITPSSANFQTYINSLNSATARADNALRNWSAAQYGRSAKAYDDIKKVKVELLALANLLRSSNISEEEFLKRRSAALQVLSDSSLIIKENGENTLGFFSRMQKLARNFSSWFGTTAMIMAAYRKVREMVTIVKELDSAMTELRKVTDETDASYDRFLKNATARAKSLGATVTDTVTATADFARLGYSINEAEDFADAAIIYKNVGDGIESITDASESIIATMQAFDGEIEDVIDIVDKFNNVGNNYAISSKGVGDALLRSAAAMRAANNDLDQTIALATAANEIVQDPDKVGTTLKTISMFLRAAKTEAEEAGESTEGMADSVSKLRDEIKSLTGVDIMLEDGKTFKSTYEILQQISKVWHSLSDVTQANLLEMMGGKRNANIVAAIMNNFSTAERALETSMHSAGSAMAENEKVLASIEGKLSILKATFEELSVTVINSAFVKGIIDAGTGLLNILNGVAKANMLIPMLVSSLGLLELKQVVMRKMAEKTAVEQIINSMKQGESVENITKAALELRLEERKRLQQSLQQLDVEDAILRTKRDQIIKGAGLNYDDTKQTGVLGSLSTVSKAMIAIGIVTSVIGVMTAAYDYFHKTTEELEASLDEAYDKAKNISKEFSSMNQSFKSISGRFVELSKGVDPLGNNVKLSKEEYEEFLSLQNQLAEMFPEIDAGIDSNGNHMLSLATDSDKLTESLNNLLETQRLIANESIADNMDESINALNDLAEKSAETIAHLKKQRSDLEYVQSAALKAVNGGGNQFSLISDSIMSDEDMNRLGVRNVSVDVVTGDQLQYTYEIIDPDKAVEQYRNIIAGLDKKIELENKKMADKWSGSRSIFSSWLQTEGVYITASDEMQRLLSNIMTSVDLSSIEGMDPEDAKQYILDTYINPIASLKDDAQNSLNSLFSMISDYRSGNATASVISDVYKGLKNLETLGIPEDVMEIIRALLGIEGDQQKIHVLRSSIVDAKNDIMGFINSLTSEEIDIAYKLVSRGMSVDQLKQAVEDYLITSSSFIDATDFDAFFTSLDSIADKINGIADAMKGLESGTALTTKEMFELAAQYPELLKQSNLFTDGSVDGQKRMLSAVLDVKEKEYDAEIDTMIAKLKAEQALVKQQFFIEKEKAALLGDIAYMSAKGEISYKKEITDKIRKYGELEGKNYVTVKQGEVDVNEKAYEAMLEQGVSYGEESAENIWTPNTMMIIDSHEKAAHYSAMALARIPEEMKNVQKYIEAGVASNKGELLKYLAEEYNVPLGYKLQISFKGSDGDIATKNLDEWYDEQKKITDLRLEELKAVYDQQMAAIENLESLKGLKLSEIYGKDPSSSSSKDSTKTEFDNLYEYHKHLVAMEQETEAEFLAWLDDAYQTAYKRGEIELDDYYKYQEEVYEGYKQIVEDAKEAFDELVEFKKDKIKQDIENQKEGLKKQLDTLKEFYDKQKEMLQDANDEEEYLKEQSEKRKNVSDLKAELEQLRKDDSAWASKRRKELEQELSDAQEELDEFEKEHSLEQALDALEKAYEEQEAAINKEIEALDGILNDPSALFNQALEGIKNNTGDLYQEMLEYNRKYGSGNDEDIKKQYEEIMKALNEYKTAYGKDYNGVDSGTPSTNSGTTTPPKAGGSSGGSSGSSGGGSSNSGSSNGSKDTTTDKTTKPSLATGATITVKKTATHFSSKSKNAKMASYVPGGKYTVYGTSGGEVLIGKNGQYTGWINKTDIVGYATGTSNATAGLHQINELGDEMIFSSKDGKNYRIFSPGEKVLNAKASNFLYNFATNGNEILKRIIDDAWNGGSRNKIQPPIQRNEIMMGDIYISGNADSKTVSAIRREQRAAVDMVLKEFIKLK